MKVVERFFSDIDCGKGLVIFIDFWYKKGGREMTRQKENEERKIEIREPTGNHIDGNIVSCGKRFRVTSRRNGIIVGSFLTCKGWR